MLVADWQHSLVRRRFVPRLRVFEARKFDYNQPMQGPIAFHDLAPTASHDKPSPVPSYCLSISSDVLLVWLLVQDFGLRDHVACHQLLLATLWPGSSTIRRQARPAALEQCSMGMREERDRCYGGGPTCRLLGSHQTSQLSDAPGGR